MSHNEGHIDRGIRLLVAAALFGAAFFHFLAGTFAILAYIVGGIALLTAAAGYCPAWALFRVNTCGVKHVPVKIGGSEP